MAGSARLAGTVRLRAAMNYRHGYHAGNHADVFKHIVLLAVLDALLAKPKPLSVLDTHAGRGHYPLHGTQARRTGEAESGILRLRGASRDPRREPSIARYLAAVEALDVDSAQPAYPGSPLLIASALRTGDRLACCELLAEEVAALRGLFAGDPRIAVHHRDGYEAMRALLPPTPRRGLVLLDPPYERQQQEFDEALAAIKQGLERWPQGSFALWYPVKRRRELRAFLRRAARLPAKAVLVCELLVRPDDTPLHLNGSGMLLVNPPWRIEQRLEPMLPALHKAIGAGGDTRLQWLAGGPG